MRTVETRNSVWIVPLEDTGSFAWSVAAVADDEETARRWMAANPLADHSGVYGEPEEHMLTATVYEPWEHARARISQEVEFAERVGYTLVSVDIEGAYPQALTVSPHLDLVQYVDRTLGMWPKRMGSGGWETDLPVPPYNDEGGNYRPVDPKFYDEAIPWPEVKR